MTKQQEQKKFSFRSDFLIRRTYNRPLNEEGTVFETFEQTIDRVINHQRWLWERAQERQLNASQEEELNDLRQLMLDRKVLMSGRTLWLGGTEVAKRREASQFNCSFTNVETVYDVVDVLWLLMQGCGVGWIHNSFCCFVEGVLITPISSHIRLIDYPRSIDRLRG